MRHVADVGTPERAKDIWRSQILTLGTMKSCYGNVTAFHFGQKRTDDIIQFDSRASERHFHFQEMLLNFALMRPTKIIAGKTFYILDPLDRFEDSKGRRYNVNGTDVAVFLFKGKLIAVSGACPHQGTSLASGLIADDCVTCPNHGWQFRTKDGTGRRDGMCDIPVYETAIADETAWIYIPASSEDREEAGNKYSDWDV